MNPVKNSFIYRFRHKFSRFSLFGFTVIFWMFLEKFNIYFFSELINNKMHRVLINWLNKRYNNLILTYKGQFSYISLSNQCIPKIIWICWWDGIDAMPEIVKACYNSVLLNSDGFNVIIVSKFNYTEYISIPPHVLEKINDNTITIALFSDMLRMSLLFKYGGLWLDSTVLVTNKIHLDNSPFFTVRREYGHDNVSKQKWTGNCIGAAPNILFCKFISDFLYQYCRDYKELLAYCLIDYSIALAYDSFPEVKTMLDNVILNNPNYMLLREHLNDEFDFTIFQVFLKDTVFHKLSWKEEYKTITSNGKQTFYGFLLDKYLP